MSTTRRLRIEVLPHGEGLPLPEYQTKGSAGMDLRAAIEEDIFIPAGYCKLIPTGVKIALPHGCEGQLRARSGLAYKHMVTLMNGVGTIDTDYRGEVGILLVNHHPEMGFMVRRGMRIAQLVVSSYVPCEVEQVYSVDTTVRGVGGFGHTGV